MASYQYIYVMKDLTKAYQAGREVLNNVTLSFLPGAKIGVLGYNGAGKSTLLKIMAGMETEFNGEAWAAEGATVGYLPQEPQLDPEKTVAGNVLGNDRVDRGTGRTAGKDRRSGCLGFGSNDRNRHGRLALPAGRISG